MIHEIFLLFLDEWLPVISFYNKSTPYIPPHLRKTNHSDVECEIVDSDISSVKENDEEKLDEIQDIKLQVPEHEEVGSRDEQESEDNKTLDEHSEGVNWSESSESADLCDDSAVRISRNKLGKKEDSKKKILIRNSKKIFVVVKEKHHLLIVPFMLKNFLIHFLQKYPHTCTLNNFLMVNTADQTNLYSAQCTGKSINVDGNEIEQYFGILLLMSVIKLEQEKRMF